MLTIAVVGGFIDLHKCYELIVVLPFRHVAAFIDQEVYLTASQT